MIDPRKLRGKYLALLRAVLESLTLGSALSLSAWNLFLRELLVSPSRPLESQWQVFAAISLMLLALIVVGSVTVSTKFWTPIGDRSDRRPGEAAVPYAIAAVSFVFYLPVLIEQKSMDPGSTIIGTVLVLAMLGRQFVMLKENTALAQLLNAQVSAREAEVAERDHFRVLVQNSSDAILVVDHDITVTYASDAVVALLGVDASQIVGLKLQAVAGPEVAHLLDGFAQAQAGGGQPVPLEWSITHDSGRQVHIESLIAHRPDDPSVRGFVMNNRDVTDRRTLERALTHRAFHDSLTGLPNRKLFTDRLQQAVNRFERYGHRFALLFCDLDSFKAVNDSAGHSLGDQLLIEVAERLTAQLRSGDTVARFGGDEFAILLEQIDDREVATAAERITASIGVPFYLNDKEFVIGASVGVVVSDSGAGTDIDDILRSADLAMYVAKALGKNRSVHFEPSMHADASSHLQLKNDLRVALATDQMTLHYQPIMNLKDQSIASVEALVRWQHPTRGLLPPREFLALCQETGTMAALDGWVLDQACRQLAHWRYLYPRSAPCTVSVNISSSQLASGTILASVERSLASAGLVPSDLILEVTENVLLDKTSDVVGQLSQLRQLGLQLAIDDFGTGYSSLNYLRHFPIDILKIDHAFVAKIGHSDQDFRLAGAITTLGQMLELKTVAEGIERPEQLTHLQSLGCDMGQGFYLSPPMSADRMAKLLAEGQEQLSS